MKLGSRSDRSLERLVRRQLPFGLLLLITTVRRRARRAALRSAPSVRRERFFLFVPAECKGQRREPAAPDVRSVSERIGWLPFAAPSCSPFGQSHV